MEHSATERTADAEPTFFEDAKEHLKSVQFNPCRFWYLVFFVSFIAGLVFLIRLDLLLPGNSRPNSAEVTLVIRTARAVTYILIFISPLAFLYLYLEVPSKHFSMMIVAILGMCFCFSLSGFAYEITWYGVPVSGRVQSFLDYEKAEYFANSKLSLYQSSVELSRNCCGVDGFMDYPLDIFLENRAPDHCCLAFAKGCGRHIFLNTPMSFARRLNPPPDNNQPCLLHTELSVANLTSLLNYDRNASIDALDELVADFNVSNVRQLLCDNLTIANYLDAVCVTYGISDTRLVSQKYKWCFTIFYNDTPREYGKFINNKFGYFKSRGCYQQLDSYASSIVDWGLTSSIFSAVLSILSLIIFFRLYEEYRSKQLNIYPLPLYLQKIPGETEDELPVGLGRRCHVQHPLALTSEKEAREFLEENPEIRQAGLEKIERDREEMRRKVEAIPKSILLLTAEQQQQQLARKSLKEDNKSRFPDQTGTTPTIENAFQRYVQEKASRKGQPTISPQTTSSILAKTSTTKPKK